MGCNCGDNEYNITVNNNGNCEPTTPVYNITLANVGVNGYSPIVSFVNEIDESFNISVNNITGTEISPAVPKLSYVADQITNINDTIANLSNTYLTKNGSNATLPFSVGNFEILSNGSLRITNGQITNLNTTNIIPRNTSGITIGYNTQGNYPINLITNDKAYYNGNEIATVNQIPTVGNGTITLTQGGATKGTFTTNQSGNATIELDAGGDNFLNIDGSNADSNFTVNGIKLAGNYMSIDNVDYGGIRLTQTDSDIYTTLAIDSNRAYLSMPSFVLNSYPYPNTSTIINSNSNFRINTNSSKFYYGSNETDSNEVATVGNIPTNYVTTDTNQASTGNNITGNKQFLGTTYVTGGKFIVQNNSNTSNLGYISGTNNLEVHTYSNRSINLIPNGTGEALYNGIEIATVNDIPTVNNPTITFTQGGVTKGTITLNQSTNKTIALDAGGSGGGAVDSVNGYTGVVVLSAQDVGALPDTTVIPTKTSDLTNDSGYLTNNISTNVTIQDGYGLLNSAGRNILTFDGTNTMFGNTASGLNLFGSTTRPQYRTGTSAFNDLALYNDIPTTISSFYNDSGYITEVTSSDVTDALGYTPVNKSGDTMTGALTIQAASPKYYLSNSNVTKGSNPTSTQYWGLTFNDSTNSTTWQNTRLFNIESSLETDGTTHLCMQALQNQASATSSSSFNLYMTQAGVASCTFPNTTCVDGQWVYQTENIVPTDTSLNGTTPLTYTLANVPNDGREYEVLLSFWGATGSTSGNYAAVLVYSDKITTETYVCRATTRTTSTVTFAGNIILPLSTSRKIYVVRQSGMNGVFQCRLRGYRRIGTNS